MAKKSRGRTQTLRPRQPSTRNTVAPRRWRLKFVIGGVVLAVVLGVGVVVKYIPGLVGSLQKSDLAPRMQRNGDKHYTLGTAGAPVVIKEFSDYT